MEDCTGHGTHIPASKDHTQACVVHSWARRRQKELQNAAPGSWISMDTGGGARFSQGLMGRRMGFEKVNLQNSIDLVSETLKEMIHDGGEAARRGWKEQQLFSEGRDKTRASSSEIGVLSRREKPNKKKSKKLKKKQKERGGV